MSQISEFDILPDGRKVQCIALQGPQLAARILTLGAIVQDLRLAGVAHPLVLGFPQLAPYLDARGRYVGAVVGRFANRIGGARFQLDGQPHQLTANEAANQLHGGADGLHQQLWQIEDLAPDQVTLSATLPDGHMGYPGRLLVRAQISVAADALVLTLQAESDAATPCSLAHHGYFILDDSGDIRRHRLQVEAAHWLPVDDHLIPTGQIAAVADSRFDFRSLRQIGPGPYDHNLCLGSGRAPLRRVAQLQGQTGLNMVLETTEPGLQIYDGRHFNTKGLQGRHYGPHAGLALETQFWPDAPNQPGFPDAILRPGQPWQAQTRYRFHRPATGGGLGPSPTP